VPGYKSMHKISNISIHNKWSERKKSQKWYNLW
jgi:hypothetical protein